MIEVYDNGGETADRYTVIIDNNVYLMSDNPLSPQGVNQYNGKLANAPLARTGERIVVESLPEQVQKAIQDRVYPSTGRCITIEVTGGVVTDVHGLPEGYTYLIADWDDVECGDMEEEELQALIEKAKHG